jgi:hypothetical protein
VEGITNKISIAIGRMLPTKMYMSLVRMEAVPSFSNKNEKLYTKTGFAKINTRTMIHS